VPDVAYVNGRIGPLADARISVQDRGFLFADGVYEVLRTYGGRIFELERHLDRFDASLRGLRLRSPLARPALARLLADLHRRSRARDVRLYVQVTRGVAPRRHAFPRHTRPTLVAWAEALPARRRRTPPPGVAVVTRPDPRWARCDLKCVALVANVLAKQEALESGAADTIFIGRGGAVREATAANVFVVRGRTVSTHRLGAEILSGVSRAVVLELARAAGLRVRETALRVAALRAADEVFLSSTMQEIVPVVRVDGRRVGDGRTGPVTRSLWERFQRRARAAPATRRTAWRRAS
jgi:D-alanine transaminase